MVVINGFWTGAVVGVLVTLAVLFVIAIHTNRKQIEMQKEVINFMENLDEAAKVKVTEIKKGDSDNENNN